MTRKTRTLLYYLLPIVFWLSAAGVCVITYSCLSPAPFVVVLVMLILTQIKRRTSSVEECFGIALLLAIASYWLPTIVFLTPCIWVYLLLQGSFSMRALCATILGYALVALYAVIAITMQWITNPWHSFFAAEKCKGWIAVGSVLLAWIFSTIARRNLRER